MPAAGDTSDATAFVAPHLDPAEQRALLRYVRAVLEEALHLDPATRPEETAALRRPAGVFVSLHRGSALRGCVGSLRTDRPLIDLVASMALAAAFRDPRFPPLSRDELAGITIELSVLSDPSPIAPGDVVPGRHGLCVIRGDDRGVLLPQVATELGWDRETFLAETARKAGLPEDAWRLPDTTLLGFSALVFSEKTAV